MMKITSTRADVRFNDKMLRHIEYLQDSDNSSLDEYIYNCEKMGNILLNLGTGFPMEIDPEEILLVANMNNLLRQMLIDFRAPEMITTEKKNNHGRK